MSKIVLDADGNEIELSDEVVEEIGKEQLDKFREENPDVDRIDELKEEAEEAKTKLSEVQAELDKAGRANTNFSELRKQKEAAEKSAKEATDKLGGEIRRVEGLIVGKSRDEAVKKYAGNDEELTKKVNHIYDTQLSGMPADTEEQIAERVRAAVTLAKPPVTQPSAGYDVFATGSGGRPPKVNDEDLGIATQFLGAETIKKNQAAVEEMRRRRGNA